MVAHHETVTNPQKERTPEEKKEFLRKAHERFRVASDAWNEIRQAALDDIKFSVGEQWEPEDIEKRRRKGRPCLTINRTDPLIRQVVNDQRQNRPSIKVSPGNDDSDIDTAKIIQGLVRHIEYKSDAETAYDTAFEYAARGGFGFFRIVTDYVSPYSFDQEILFKRVRNPFSIYLDPFFQNIDGSDVKYGFAIDDIDKDDFKQQFPDSDLCADGTDFESIGDNAKEWIADKTFRVAEYYYTEYEQKIIYLLNNGQATDEDGIKNLPEGLEVVDRRDTVIPKICWAKITAADIIEERDIPGRFIPIIPVLGAEIEVDGKLVLKGIVRDSKDSQRIYNYEATNQVETIALAPKAPWIGFEGQFEGHEDKWETANTENWAYLEVKPKTIGGVPAPLPQRTAFEPAIQAITQARQLAGEDMKATTGMYDAALGNRSNEQSGIAIKNRAAQAQTSNFHLVDNLSKSIRHGGRIVVDWIPVIYDTARAERIIGDDGSEDIVKLNQIFEENGQQKQYDLSLGEYETTIDTGPSFQTKRQEAAASIADLVRSWPQLMQYAGDLLVNNMDWPGARELGERLQKLLPPALQPQQKGKAPVDPQAQAQMAQMGQLIQRLTQELNIASQMIETKSIEISSKERIANARLKTDAEIMLAKLKADGAKELLAHQVDEITRRQNILGQNQPINPMAQLQAAADQNPNFNGSAPQPGAPAQLNQQPTGGQAPG